MKKFPLGFWNYPSIDKVPLSEVARWREAGMTSIQTPVFSYETDKKEQLLAFLDEIEAQGMDCFLRIRDMIYKRFVGREEELAALIDRVRADFGDHPAVRGYYIGDEPRSPEEIRTCVEMFRIIRERAPEAEIFLNFLPYYTDIENDCLGGQRYDEWISGFLKETGCKILSTDCYCQLNPEREGIHNYFMNLHKNVAAAEAGGAECYNTVLSCGHFRYRVPTEDDLRWQLSTSVASGVRGILWFLYYEENVGNNYRGAPVDALGEESETYRALRRVQRIFLHDYADYMVRLRHTYTCHFCESFGGYPMFESGVGRVRRASSGHGTPGILSTFTDEEGKEYLVVVNNDQRASDLFTFRLDPGLKVLHRYRGTQDVDFITTHHDARYSVVEGCPTVGIFLAPGQMELFRAEY